MEQYEEIKKLSENLIDNAKKALEAYKKKDYNKVSEFINSIVGLSENEMRLILGAGQAQLLFIPAGLIHGCANPFARPMTLIYLVNQYWTGADEYRIDYQIFGQNFWRIQAG